MQTALEEARASLAALKEGDGSKQQESNDLKREAAKIQKELSAKEANVEVRSDHVLDRLTRLTSSHSVVVVRLYAPKSPTRVTKSMKPNHRLPPINQRTQFWLL
jgi:hypothetical protein